MVFDPFTEQVINVPGASQLDVLQSIGGRFIAAAQWIGNPHNWIRVAQVIIGGALFIAGVIRMSQPILAPVEKKAGQAAEVAAVL